MTELWTTSQCARHCGCKSGTWRDYVSRAGAPAAVSREPGAAGELLHLADAVRAWQAGRPGRGARTDLD